MKYAFSFLSINAKKSLTDGVITEIMKRKVSRLKITGVFWAM